MGFGARTLLVCLAIGGAAGAQDVRRIREQVAWLANTHERARAALIEMGPQAFKPILECAREQKDDLARARALDVLLELSKQMPSVEKYGSAIATILRKDHAPAVRAAAARLLLRAGPKNARSIERVFTSKYLDARFAAAKALAALGEAGAPLIEEDLESPSVLRRRAACHSIRHFKSPPPRFVARLYVLTKDPEPVVRLEALLALDALDPESEKVVATLAGALDDPDEQVRLSCARRLLPGHLRVLVAHATSPQGVRLVERTLKHVDESMIPQWFSEAKSSESGRAVLLTGLPRALIRKLPPDAQSQIRAWAGPENDTQRAALGIATHPDFPGAVDLAIEYAQAPEALHSLGMLGHGNPKAAARIKEVLAATDSQPVRMEAVVALWKLGEPGPDPLPSCLAALPSTPSAAKRVAELGALAFRVMPDLVKLASSSDPTTAIHAKEAIGHVLDCRQNEAYLSRMERFHKLAERDLVARGLAWLAKHQDTKAHGINAADGRWDSDGFLAHGADGLARAGNPACDVGLTGLALLAFLNAGYDERHNEFGPNVKEAIAFLVKTQRASGLFGTPDTQLTAVQHAIATTAVCEAAVMCGRPDLVACGRRGANYALKCQNPGLRWGYGVRNGYDNSFVTVWMTTALKSAAFAGIDVDPHAFEHAAKCIDKLTDDEFGRVGYDYAGTSPARPRVPGSLESDSGRVYAKHSECTTAMGAWARILCGEPTAQSLMIRKAFDICHQKPPEWAPETQHVDMCYWRWGALFMAQSGKSARAWRASLVAALKEHQEVDGSWAPVGPWQGAGTVFSTAQAVLALLAPVGYPEGSLDGTWRRRVFREAYDAIR